MFSPVLITEPLLEFRNGVTLRSPRRGMMNPGPYDYGKIPEVKVALLLRHELVSSFDKFWHVVVDGDAQSGYRGFAPTFGSKLTILKRSVYDQTTTLKDWITRESFNLPPHSVVLVCLTDEEVERNYFELKTAVMLQGPRAQLLTASVLNRASPGFIAIGLATGIYAKAGGTPWRLVDPLAPSGLFVGLGFAIAKESSDIYFGVVEVYDRFGKLVEVTAEAYKSPMFRSTEGLFIPQGNLTEILQGIKSRLNPLFLIAHKSGQFHKEELAAFDKLALPQALVHLEFSNAYRLYDSKDPKLAAFRGLLAKDTESSGRGILLTTGNINDTFVVRHQMGTPRAIEVNVQKNTVGSTLEQLSDQVLKLTKLDWNTLATAVRKPITITYAATAAGFAAEGYTRTVYDVRDLI